MKYINKMNTNTWFVLLALLMVIGISTTGVEGFGYSRWWPYYYSPYRYYRRHHYYPRRYRRYTPYSRHWWW